MVRVATANFYVGNPHPHQDAQLLASLDCELNGVQEGHSGNAKAIRRELHRTHHVFWGHEDTINHLDVPIVIQRHRVKTLRMWTRNISKRAQPENIGAPRNATAARVVINGETYTFINTHTNAAVQNPVTKKPFSTNIKRVAEFVRGMIVLEAMIMRAQRRGDLVILVGDLNFRETQFGVWKFSPQAMFKRRKMRYVVHTLDYIAYSKSLSARNVKTVPKTKTGSDHAWLTAELV